ncbi:hypothetical protein A2W14_01165 [Candidatus Gottesmanbacteria bacterium RBG_16_37_8]|uniref:FtsK domain-containing protein n=1 Tax=Candidatus Gottesmanbacteria bacterium RBG_16_37_8 TaxID=1798371 RepID=A0A1F5YRE8_9BACT|nr:MAG: hypothetical protein A2W14_01165 [Candidatus Gottesmanbacteria bacterium RBG_16_37_8]
MSRRRYRRRRKKFLTPRKGTIFSIMAMLIFASSLLMLLSFFQNGSVLDQITIVLSQYFGVLRYLLPFILISLALLLANLKIIRLRPNIPIGLILIFLCLLGLSQSGDIGEYIWLNFSSSLADIGSFILLSVMLLIGLIVLFNTSIEEIVKFADLIFSAFSSLTKTDKKKPLFAEKLPIKAPVINQAREITHTDEKSVTPVKAKKADNQAVGQLGISPISNLPGTITVWEYPPLDLLAAAPTQRADRGDMKQNAQTIEKTLESFGITARVAEVNLGPAFTQYCLEIAQGTKLSKINALQDDLALALAARTGQVRIDAPIPGKKLVGIEIPNEGLEYVTLKQMLSQDVLKRDKSKLLVPLGLDATGKPEIANIAKMPHVLIAGATGSGKSVLLNAWIATILFRTTPAEVKLILVDSKRVELSLYNGIPHLLAPVIVEPHEIVSALKWAIKEMEDRYKLFSQVGVRNIDGYNEQSGFQAIPNIVIVIDELAALMGYAPVEVEDSICRLAQMARATGIHLVVATQSPRVDVITGLIKANIPTRISFSVTSMMDSRVILDLPGADKLLGRGDMMYIPPEQAKATRIQGAFITEAEVTRLVTFLKNKNIPTQYTTEVTSQEVSLKKGTAGGSSVTGDGRDDFFEEAVRVVCQYDRASASLLQRRLKIGYARAARILDQLEEEGIVGTGEGAKPREVLMKNPDEYLSGRGETGSPPPVSPEAI